MAVDFTPTDYLSIDQPAVAGYPFAVSAWVQSDSVLLGQTIFFVGDKDAHVNYAGLYLRGDAGDVARAFVHNHGGGVTGLADTANTYVAGTWYHVAGVFLATGIYCYLAGDIANKGTDEVGIPVPAAWDRTSIGYTRDLSPALPFDGRIAWVAVWDLTNWGANDAARLARFEGELPGMATGWSPQVHGPGKVGFWPLGGLHPQHYRDVWGSFDMAQTGAPGWADHPGGLIYPSSAPGVPAAAAPPPGAIMNLMQGANLGADLYNGTLAV